MKSTDFKSVQSRLRILEEIRPPKKKINWDRVIYLIILICSIFAILLMVLKKHIFVKGEGQVLFKKLDIQYTQDIQIVDFVHHEGDSVEVGDTLFLFYDEATFQNRPIPADGHLQSKVKISSDNLDWITRERISTEKKIEIAAIQIREAEEFIEMLNEQGVRIEQEVYLDVYPVTKLEENIDRRSRFQNEILIAQKEIEYLQKYLQGLTVQEYLERRLLDRKNTLPSMGSHRNVQAYVSPVNGVITRTYKENYEVALESEIILSIHKPTNLYIKAFYDQKDLRHLSEGDLVDVKFPDGTASFGVLQRFYFATYRLPEEFQKKYEPTTRSLAVDIIPINEIEIEKWRAFYKLNVVVSKPLLEL